MAHIYNFTQEFYECFDCGKNLAQEELADDWKCPFCGETPTTKAVDDKGTKHTINRVKANDLMADDWLVLVPSFENMYQVIDVRRKNGGFEIPLKGYRVYKCGADDFLVQVTGAW